MFPGSGGCFSERPKKFPNYRGWRHQMVDFQWRRRRWFLADVFRISQVAPGISKDVFSERPEKFPNSRVWRHINAIMRPFYLMNNQTEQ
jgi:hypothetical protein